jgi:hypothetical protein
LNTDSGCRGADDRPRTRISLPDSRGPNRPVEEMDHETSTVNPGSALSGPGVPDERGGDR